jgi:putative DNA primase/helicase
MSSNGSLETEQSPPLPTPDIAALARLSSIDYDRVREIEAGKAGIRVATLDHQVKQARGKPSESKGIRFAEVEPWREPVHLAELLDDLQKALKRYIVCDEETATAATLWIALTWLVERAQVAPLAIITAPEKRCGKSQLLDFIGRLVLRP